MQIQAPYPVPVADVLDIAHGLSEEERERFYNKRVLLAGGRGFLGRYLTSALSELGALTDVLDNGVTSGKLGDGIDGLPRVHCEHADLTREDLGIHPFLQKSASFHYDFVLHASGIASPEHYRALPLETLKVSIIGSEALLIIARQDAAKYLFFSSSEIYGDPDPAHVPTTEDYRGYVSCVGPRACYDEGKRVGETLASIYFNKYGVHTNVVRPFNVYGPGMQAKDYRVLPNFAARLKKGEDLQVYGSGTQTRTYCYVTDAITGILKILLHGQAGEAYNIGNPEPEIGAFELAAKVKGMYPNSPSTIRVIPHPTSYPADEPQRRCPNICKAGSHLDYVPKVSLDDGLKRFLNWAMESYE